MINTRPDEIPRRTGVVLKQLEMASGSSNLQSRKLNSCFTEMCSCYEAGSYLRRIDFVYHSASGLRVIKKKEKSYP